MMQGIHKLFLKRNKVRQYGYDGEYGDIDDMEMEDEDIFPDERDGYHGDEYANEYNVEDEFFD